MQCPDCGAYYVATDDFCGECGRPLKQAPPASPRSAEEAKDLPTMEIGAAPPPRAAPAVIAPKTPRQPAPQQPASARKKTNLMPALILAVIGLVLCCLFAGGMALWIGSSSATPTPEPTLPPLPTATPLPAPTEPLPDKGPGPAALIYADDFSDIDSGWDTNFENETEAGYTNGEYRLAVYRTDYVVWGNPSMAPPFGDIRIEVDTRHEEGPLDNNFGILVRYQDDDEGFYWFQISSDGYYSVDMREFGEWATLVEWQESGAIRQGAGTTNRLAVEATGNQFSFYVNDEFLTSITADAFPSGNIGLAVGAFDEPGVVIHFDNVMVYER
jgi:hypothetical protein